jgi:methylated-DNA-[protein]-cysteine S-methyltransferase
LLPFENKNLLIRPMNLLQDFDAVFSCPFGGIGLRLQENRLFSLDFIYQRISAECFSSPEAESIATDIRQYFYNPQVSFDCKLQLSGTAFQKKVWLQLQQIPSGQVLTYGELAEKLKTSPRAVGNACRKNPVPLVIPCHRVVAKNGLGGFAGNTEGESVQVKQWLLDFEAGSA